MYQVLYITVIQCISRREKSMCHSPLNRKIFVEWGVGKENKSLQAGSWSWSDRTTVRPTLARTLYVLYSLHTCTRLSKREVFKLTHLVRFIFDCCMPALIKENDVNYPILQVVKYFFKVGNLIVINSGKLGMCNFESFGWWEANAAFYTYLNSQNKSLNNGAVFGEGKVSDVHCTRANELSCWATKGLSRAACFTTFNKKTHAIKLNLMRFNGGGGNKR